MFCEFAVLFVVSCLKLDSLLSTQLWLVNALPMFSLLFSVV